VGVTDQLIPFII